MNSHTNESHPSQLLRDALEQRLAIIADHQWRDSNPQTHLDALKAISTTITKTITLWQKQEQIPKKLDHFLRQSSYLKALEYLNHQH